MDDTKSPVLFHGVLEKLGKYTGSLNARKCDCSLKEDRFIYRKEGDKAKNLEVVQFQSIRSVRECSFEIVTQSTMHVFVASSTVERDSWVKAMQELMWLASIKRSHPTAKSLQLQLHVEDNDAVSEAVQDYSKLGNRLPLSMALSVTDKSAKDTKGSINHSSVRAYETLPSRVKPVVMSQTSEVKNPAEIGKESPVALVAPSTDSIIRGTVQQSKSNRLVYDEARESMPVFASSLYADASSGNDSANSGDLYAYASADDVRKVLLKDRPKLCNEYSSVHDNRCSEFLYSEVVEDGHPSACARFIEAARILDSSKIPKQKSSSSSALCISLPLQVTENRTSNSECKTIDNDDGSDAVVQENPIYSHDPCASESGAEVITGDDIRATGEEPNISSKECCGASSPSLEETQDVLALCEKPWRLAGAPNKTVSLKGCSAFDEMRTFMSTLYPEGEAKDLATKTLVPKGVNWVSDLKQFLKELE